MATKNPDVTQVFVNWINSEQSMYDEVAALVNDEGAGASQLYDWAENITGIAAALSDGGIAQELMRDVLESCDFHEIAEMVREDPEPEDDEDEDDDEDDDEE